MKSNKVIITIFQCKRSVLPHFFIKYIYPKMKIIFPGEMKVYLIQHISKNVESKSATKSSSISNDCLDMVRTWTENGMYNEKDVTIIQHDTVLEKYPQLPSYRKGVELFLKEDADFHLWLEDDALVFDKSCDRWPELLKDVDVGVYRNHINTMINCAFFIGTKNYEKRLHGIMQDESKWDNKIEMFSPLKEIWNPLKNIWDPSEEIWDYYNKNKEEAVRKLNLDSPQIECIITRLCKSRYFLNKDYATRTHLDSFKNSPNINLLNFMININPEETLKLLPLLKEEWERENLKIEWLDVKTDIKEILDFCYNIKPVIP